MNRLQSESSAYLKHAADQKIDWYPWSEEAFERAREENKPVFLSSGGVWCHWCHVMAKESFYNEETAGLLNDHFISIKLDRDEHPDIDRIYQQAVSAMGSGGGWPLSVFLTSEKKPFFGGTYFPPVDGHGRPAFNKILREVVRFYRENQGQIAAYTEKLLAFLKQEPHTEGDVNEGMLDGAVRDIMEEYDSTNGGFGKIPKFHMPGAVEFLLNRYFITGKTEIAEAVTKTLRSMARGGFHDQLQGGFHRYSTDESWIVPHFEKMADDNAWLLRNYADAYGLFGDEDLKEAAEGIIVFLKEVLSDPSGGFYASQDADVTPDDEGGYFTWTEDDFRRVLGDEAYQILSLYFLNERGSMHHDKTKKVLSVALDSDEVASRLGIPPETVNNTVKTGKEKLLKERTVRKAPFIDKAIYPSLNGLLISACLRAYRSIPDEWLRDFSLKSIRRIMREHFDGNMFFHAKGVKALLADYIFFIDALITAYETTAERWYLNNAKILMAICIDRLWDKDEGGFFDSEADILNVRLKGIEDMPHPSANALAVIVLLKLHNMNGNGMYHKYAETSLKIFALRAKDMGVHAGYYYCALDAYLNMTSLSVNAEPLGELAAAARSVFFPYKCITYGENSGQVVACRRGVCYEPLESPEDISEFFREKMHQ